MRDKRNAPMVRWSCLAKPEEWPAKRNLCAKCSASYVETWNTGLFTFIDWWRPCWLCRLRMWFASDR